MIIHIDMDAFYAAVEERDNPGLAGRPVIVGAAPELRGVVSAANYLAREYGVHSAMPMSRALRLCPGAIRRPVNMRRYVEVSQQIRDIFCRYTPLIEPLALDEAFLDVQGSERLFGTAAEIGKRIRQEIKQELGLVASVGVAPNKFIAKIASDVEKPDAYVLVELEQVQAFLDPLPVSRLWGVGKATEQVFARLGIRSIRQVRQQPLSLLQDHFGKLGEHLYLLAQGIDQRPVVPDRNAKSISNETTFAVDISDSQVLHTSLMQLTEQLAGRLRQAGLSGRTVQLKIRYSDFKLITRSTTLDNATNVTRIIWQAVLHLFQASPMAKPVRLLGVGMSGFADRQHRVQQQGDLFTPQDARQESIDALTDHINKRYGPAALHRASGQKQD